MIEANSEISLKESRVRKITHLYYSRPEIQKAIFEFCKNREICPRFFEGFGKRPDVFQYPGDVFELTKKGATSFHCSEELWKDPMQIETGMNEARANELRIGWDLLIDIDCKWFDYSKLAMEAIIKILEKNGVKNIGIKFSGSKGWHIIIPWKSFPKEVGGIETKNRFPELPRILINYLRFYAEKELKKNLPEDFFEQFKNVNIKKGIKCKGCQEISNEYELVEFFCNKCNQGEQRRLQIGNKEEFWCPGCRKKFEKKNSIQIYECPKCKRDSKKNPDNFLKTIETDLFELMGLDLILVSPRHLFRAPYSLHEKTALASVVLSPEEISKFELKDADPMKIKIKNFMPECREGEARELLMQALDWDKYQNKKEERKSYEGFKPIQLSNLSEQNFPPCVRKILEGVGDGKKRSVFALINLFRIVGMERDELEKRIYEWNKKNKPALKEGYIKTQISWSYAKNPVMPSNCKEFYQGIGVCVPDDMCKMVKNPVSYVVRKNNIEENRNKKFEKPKRKSKKQDE